MTAYEIIRKKPKSPIKIYRGLNRPDQCVTPIMKVCLF